ncbi:MAG TPA: hypothetical protein ENN90_10910 [Mariniphaga anaerophila]|uniref:Uncharacterized protein n=1 Tax=Mariniphaga anaerophila TaxID=1484053 RepID=A0A831LM17_9BACT|nr:hypothetical protein [Mariniphaga anaerophila]
MDSKNKLLLILFIAVFPFSLFSQSSWISDEEMKFKILVPDNYQKNQFREGTDKILAVLSPDQNVAVRVRAFPASEQVTVDLIQQVFEQNVISGSSRLTQEDGHLNQIPARAAAYAWRYNNMNTVVGSYYIIQNGTGYIVWTLIPRNLLQQRSKEADKILDSFSLLEPSAGNLSVANGFGSPGQQANPQNRHEETQVVLTDFSTGTNPGNDLQLSNISNAFSCFVPTIDLVFGYTGNATGSNFIVKWYNDTHQISVKEFTFSPPDAEAGRGHAFITNNGNPWPGGDYHVEIWHSGNVLGKKSFVVSTQKSQFPESQPQPLSQPGYFSLVSDDACIEHLAPDGYRVSENQTGLSVWKNGSGINMVQQIVIKQNNMQAFISNQISTLKDQGATVINTENFSQSGLQVYQYVYEYGNSLFAYSASENNSAYYLLGFVGNKNERNQILKLMDETGRSFKKANCSGDPGYSGSNPDPVQKSNFMR